MLVDMRGARVETKPPPYQQSLYMYSVEQVYVPLPFRYQGYWPCIITFLRVSAEALNSIILLIYTWSESARLIRFLHEAWQGEHVVDLGKLDNMLTSSFAKEPCTLVFSMGSKAD